MIRRMKRRRRTWVKGAVRVPGRDPGVMDGNGGTRKVTIHTEAPRGGTRGKYGRDGNAITLARYVAGANTGYHLVYDYSGCIAQLYKPRQGSRALLVPPGASWSPNRQGDVNIQLCFAGITDAADVAHWPMKNWDRLLAYFDAWGIPRDAITDFHHPTRSERHWRRSGWTCHAAAPMNDHQDGRGLPIKRLLNWDRRGGR